MLFVAVTGGMGVGKSRVCQIFREQGYAVNSSDDLGHRCLQKEDIKKALFEKWGKGIFDSDGSVNRQRLGQIVFCSLEDLKALEALTHPCIRIQTKIWKQECERENQKIAFVEVPLLFEKRGEKRFDFVVVVTASQENVENRLKKSGIKVDDMKKRMNYQLCPLSKVKKADFIIKNDGDQEALVQETKRVLSILQMSEQKRS